MKNSRYNVNLPYKDKVILFNTLHRNSLMLENELAVFLNDYQNNPQKIAEMHSELFSLLSEQHFIIDRDVDELEQAENLRKLFLFQDKHYHLTILPTLDCNFSCWYCYENKISGSKMQPQLVKAVQEHIKRVVNDSPDLESFHLYFFGGEPFLKWSSVIKPTIDSFVKKIENSNIQPTLQFTTNGVLINGKIISQLKEHADYTYFQITFDGYGERHNRSRSSKQHPDSYQILIDKVKTLANNGILTTLRINYTKDIVDDLMMILKEFDDCSLGEKAKIVYCPQRVWQDSDKCATRKNIVVTEEERFVELKEEQSVAYAQAIGMQTTPPQLMDSVRVPCKHAMKNSALINYDGNVFKCCVRDFSEKNRKGVLYEDGVIEWNKNVDELIMRRPTDYNACCEECFMLPICGGGCPQNIDDFQGQEYCMYGFEDKYKKDALKKFLILT